MVDSSIETQNHDYDCDEQQVSSLSVFKQAALHLR